MLLSLLFYYLTASHSLASNATISGNLTESDGPLNLPSFTYEKTEDDIKEAAYRHGLKIRNEPENKLVLPEVDIDALIRADRNRNWQQYRWNPYYAQQRRIELMADIERRLRLARSDHKTKMVRICYNRCNAYINETFQRPDLSPASNASSLLMRLEMAEFPAKYLSMTLDEMRVVTSENCEQWEADYQCIFGCSADAALVDRMKEGLAGDFHLTANVECPNPNFAEFLPCVGEKTAEWISPCEKQFKNYETLKSQVNGRVEMLEQQIDILTGRNSTANRFRPLGSDSYVLRPYTLQIQTEQSRLCAAYGDLLMCTLAKLKSLCSERAASFVHTSLAENFASTVLKGRELVKRRLGSLSSVCLQLANKATFRLFPIRK